MSTLLRYTLAALVAVAALALSLPAANAALAAPDTQTPSIIGNTHASVWCLGTQDHRDDAQAILQYCDTGPGDTLWHVGSENPTHAGYYQIINANNQCLGVYGGSTAQGADIVSWTCLGPTHPDQYWKAGKRCGSAQVDQRYLFQDLESGYVMGVAGNGTDRGDVLRQQPFNSGIACEDNGQFWAPHWAFAPLPS